MREWNGGREGSVEVLLVAAEGERSRRLKVEESNVVVGAVRMAIADRERHAWGRLLGGPVAWIDIAEDGEDDEHILYYSLRYSDPDGVDLP